MSDYFEKLQTALHEAEIAKPVLIVDLERLHQNIKVMMDFLPPNMGYRIVAKSLPCEALIKEVISKTGTNRLMVFNLDYLELLSQIMPQSNILLGKPLPVKAMENFLTVNKNYPKIQWLIDSLQRLKEYERTAQKLNQKLNINLELNVGLHRGGFNSVENVGAVLEQIKASDFLNLSGFMGYEPHLASLPLEDGWRDRAKNGAWSFYQAVLNLTQAKNFNLEKLTRNAAGSPTYRLYYDTNIANEVSVGSVLLKPTDFDTDLLKDHIAACFIATPVLKTIKGIHVPGAEYSNQASNYKVPQNTNTAFIYGGKWHAKPIYPQGFKVNYVYGKSSNQEMLEVPDDIELKVDDFVFFRPTQSEAVLTYFGDIAVYENGTISNFWQSFPAKP